MERRNVVKTVIVNGGPRKEWNTAQLLCGAAEGAQAAGAETEYIDLYDLSYSGCRSCLACKRKGVENPCRCFFRDGLSPVIEKVHQAHHLIIGSPIYFGQPTGQLRCFLERVLFPTLSYNSFSRFPRWAATISRDTSSRDRFRLTNLK